MKKCLLLGWIVPVIFAWFFSASTVNAKEVPALEEVVVTATRVEEKRKEVARNIQVITEDEIKSSSAKDVGELLAEKGIGHIQKYPGLLTSIGIRGFKTDTHGNDLQSHVLILVDGRRAGTGNLAKILTKNVERIEIVRGPGSVQYGSSGIGGIINVITKRGKGRPSIFVEGTLGSFGYQGSTVGFSGSIDKFDFSGSYTSEGMDDYETAKGVKYQNTGFDSKANSSLNIGFEIFPKNRIGLIYHYFDVDHAGSPGYLSNNDPDDYTDQRNESIDLVYDGAAPEISLHWKVRYFSGEDIYKWVDPKFQSTYEDNVDQEGAQTQISWDNKSVNLTGGVDWVHYEVDSTSAPRRSEYKNPGYFLLAKTRLFDQRVILSGGLRYDHYKVKIKKGEGGSESENHLGPEVGLAFMATDFLKLRAHYGEGFMMPSAKQLAGDYRGWYGRYIGNPDLDPEKSKTYEGGADFSYGPVNSSITYFYTKFKDKIQATTTSTGDNTWENIGKATISGIEGDFSVDIGEFFDWSFEVRPYASLVYLTKYEDEETGKDLLYTSNVSLSYGITVSDMEGFSANLNFAYLGDQKVEDYESGWPAPVVKKSDFTVVNLTITKRILDFNKYGKFTLKGEVRNLFNKDYEYVKGYPMPGRSVFLGLRYDF